MGMKSDFQSTIDEAKDYWKTLPNSKNRLNYTIADLNASIIYSINLLKFTCKNYQPNDKFMGFIMDDAYSFIRILDSLSECLTSVYYLVLRDIPMMLWRITALIFSFLFGSSELKAKSQNDFINSAMTLFYSFLTVITDLMLVVASIIYFTKAIIAPILYYPSLIFINAKDLTDSGKADNHEKEVIANHEEKSPTFVLGVFHSYQDIKDAPSRRERTIPRYKNGNYEPEAVEYFDKKVQTPWVKF